MVFRLLRYMVRIWDTWQRSNKGATKLPPVIPVVLSHAPGGWTAARELLELIDGPEDLVEVLRPHLPSFAPVLEDVAHRTDEELETMQASALARLVVLLLKHVRDGDLMSSPIQDANVFGEILDSRLRAEAGMTHPHR